MTEVGKECNAYAIVSCYEVSALSIMLEFIENMNVRSGMIALIVLSRILILYMHCFYTNSAKSFSTRKNFQGKFFPVYNIEY